MKYHKYDKDTGIYIETIEAEEQPENSVPGDLPEETKYYTVAFINSEWVSVVRPEVVIIDGQFELKD